MTPQNRMHSLTLIGLGFLILASLARLLLHRVTHLPENTVDLTTGILYGLAIGCMLLGIMKSRRRPVV